MASTESGAATRAPPPHGDLRRPVSRVLYPPAADGGHLSGPAVTDGLERPTRGRGRVPLSSYLALLRMGFAQLAGLPTTGELLPRHCTLTRQRRAVYFCGTFRRVSPPGSYPASFPVELGLSSRDEQATTRSPMSHERLFQGCDEVKCNERAGTGRSGHQCEESASTARDKWAGRNLCVETRVSALG